MLPSQILTLLAARLTTLDPGPYLQGIASEAWHESATPWGPTQEGTGLAHLAFVPIITRSPPTDERGRPGEDVYVASDLEVHFCYRLRPGSQNEDYRQALNAATDICRAVNDTASWAPECSVDVLDLGQAFPPGDDNEFMLIRTIFRVHHSVEV